MKTIMMTSASLAVLLLSATAGAQQTSGEKPYIQQQVSSVENAFELTMGTGYTQGFGSLESGVGMPTVAKAGIAFDLGAGYRIDPHWGVNVGGQYQELSAERGDAARGVTATVAAQYHIDPNIRLDPFVELGAGYRMLWETAPGNSPNVFTHGLQLARARVGLDLRVSPEVAISPVIGADANLFLWQDVSTSSAIASPTLSTFVFGGLQGRMDIGGTKVGTTSVTSASQE